MIFNLKDSSIYKFLEEMKTKEEYGRESFKKKYNYKSSKENKDIGTITDKNGKEYKVDIRKNKNHTTESDLSDKDSKISLDNKFFKLKGSNKNERRDAVLNHEIGHQNLHNINPNNKTVDKRNRSGEVFKKTVTSSVKNQGLDLDNNEKLRKEYGANPKNIRKQVYDDLKIKDYLKDTNKLDISKRNKSLSYAEKYSKKDKDHHDFSEYEADRYAANKTSEKALKKGIRNYYKLSKKVVDKANGDSDMKQRSKALKDEKMRKSDTYK